MLRALTRPNDLDHLLLARRLTRGAGRRVRVAADLSLCELAAALGVTAGTLSRWETGETRPSAALATRWVVALRDIQSQLDGDVLEQLRKAEERAEGAPHG